MEFEPTTNKSVAIRPSDNTELPEVRAEDNDTVVFSVFCFLLHGLYLYSLHC